MGWIVIYDLLSCWTIH